MVATEIKEFDLRVFVLVDIGVRSFVVGDVIEGHPRRLLAQFIAHEREAGALQGGPDFFDVVVIHNVRLAHCQRIDGDGQDTLQRP